MGVGGMGRTIVSWSVSLPNLSPLERKVEEVRGGLPHFPLHTSEFFWVFCERY